LLWRSLKARECGLRQAEARQRWSLWLSLRLYIFFIIVIAVVVILVG
jgi:hypothetical protein